MRRFVLVGIFLSVICSTVTAATVTYSVGNVAGNVWRYQYEVSGRSFSAGEGLTIYFPVASSLNLVNGQAASDWDQLLIQPDTNLPADGFFDVLALVSNPALTGFAVDFTFAGNPPPGSQIFEIYNSSPFNILETGRTVLGGEIPEPGTFLLTGGAFIAVLMCRRSFKQVWTRSA